MLKKLTTHIYYHRIKNLLNVRQNLKKLAVGDVKHLPNRQRVEALRRRAVHWRVHMKYPFGNDFPVRHAERGAEKSAKEDECHLLRERSCGRSNPNVTRDSAQCSINRAERSLLRVDQLEQMPREATEETECRPHADGEVLPEGPHEKVDDGGDAEHCPT